MSIACDDDDVRERARCDDPFSVTARDATLIGFKTVRINTPFRRAVDCCRSGVVEDGKDERGETCSIEAAKHELEVTVVDVEDELAKGDTEVDEHEVEVEG